MIDFCKACESVLPTLKEWFQKPYIQEYWGTDDNTWNNLFNNIVYGEKDLFDYWIASYKKEPYALLVTTDAKEGAPEHLLPYVEQIGNTLTLDVMIGNEKFLGKGLAAKTITSFFDYLGTDVSAVLIDPEINNKKAIHVYQKAGFSIVSKFVPIEGEFRDKEHYLMKWVRK